MGIVDRMLQQPVKANGPVLRLAFDSVRRDMLRKSTAICDPKAGVISLRGITDNTGFV